MLNQNFQFAVNSTVILLLFQRVYDALYASDGLSCLFYKLGLLNRRGLFNKSNTEVLPKCQFGTLGELAVLDLIKKNPSVKQTELVEQTGKSVRSIKHITDSLKGKQYIRRVDGKWKILI